VESAEFPYIVINTAQDGQEKFQTAARFPPTKYLITETRSLISLHMVSSIT